MIADAKRALSGPWPGRARLAAVGLFLLSLVAGLLVPVYTDEIGWRFQERAAVDHGIDVMYNDLCGPNSLGHPPWFMMPARWYSALANQAFADPWFVRVEGVLCALIWALLLLVLIARLEADRDRRTRLQALAFVLLSLGVQPFLMVMSRPEQPIMLAFTISILLCLTRWRPAGWGEQAMAWITCAAIVVLVSIAQSYHLKGVLYAPVALVCLALCADGRRTLIPRGAGIVALLAITLGSARYWVGHLKCVAGDPQLAAHYARENVASVLTGSHPGGGLALQLVHGLNPFEYVVLAMANNRPMSEWLPPYLFSPAVLVPVDIGMLLVWLLAMWFGLRELARFVRAEGWRAVMQPRVPIALAIIGCIMAWGASQLKRNDYEAAHVLPMLVLFCVLCLSLPRRAGAGGDHPLTGRFVGGFVSWAVGFMVIGQITVLAHVLPPLVAAAQVPGYLDAQRFSVSIGGYGKVRRDIAQAMRQSGISAEPALHRVLIDDVTYLALQKSTLPLHRLGVLEAWNDGIDDPVAYLISRDSSGVVVGCRYLPPRMRAAATRVGEICALSRAGLERIDAPD